MKKKIENDIRNVQFSCADIDIWPSEKRNFFGMTAHWIGHNLKREKEYICIYIHFLEQFVYVYNVLVYLFMYSYIYIYVNSIDIFYFCFILPTVIC